MHAYRHIHTHTHVYTEAYSYTYVTYEDCRRTHEINARAVYACTRQNSTAHHFMTELKTRHNIAWHAKSWHNKAFHDM